jgi:hypothetical protein
MLALLASRSVSFPASLLTPVCGRSFGIMVSTLGFEIHHLRLTAGGGGLFFGEEVLVMCFFEFSIAQLGLRKLICSGHSGRTSWLEVDGVIGHARGTLGKNRIQYEKPARQASLSSLCGLAK